ncbi:sigma-70 family RNA polymerase sigma factor [Polynucleobacter sp. es-MAR-4]|uniref:sigma-70 family RNA polymerase sigma factor n=1 Tax=Polynucleobacter sp. es-MAR-4 TaxID=1855655 RepID=UPI001C0DE130|nr:sigma-70 family RNA polymerase sigma factor [Polynucleobacter sp. es-MAR-4]MBU3636073.1 sigma-70 family RNA polymerase sigma factor [Polynucleobacter sp. es-MAR-4]
MNIEIILPTLIPILRKFALLQLRNEAMANDAVQEVCLAAIQNGQTFRGESELKTWLIAILKNKIIDHLRVESRKVTSSPNDFDGDDFSGLFNKRGHWNEEDRPANWGNPDEVLEKKRFWEIFEVCMTTLPEKLARIFSMAEFLGMESKEICKELEITSSNYWVIMHRARMHLRICLEKRGLGIGK